MAPGNLSQISLRMPAKSGMAASSSAVRTSPPRSAATMTSFAISEMRQPDLVDDRAGQLAGRRDARPVFVPHDYQFALREIRRGRDDGGQRRGIRNIAW